MQSFKGAREPRSNAVAPLPVVSCHGGHAPRGGWEDDDPPTPRIDVRRSLRGRSQPAVMLSPLPATCRPAGLGGVGGALNKAASARGTLSLARLHDLEQQVKRLDELDATLRLSRRNSSRTTDSSEGAKTRPANNDMRMSMPRYHHGGGGRTLGSQWQDLPGASDHSSSGNWLRDRGASSRSNRSSSSHGSPGSHRSNAGCGNHSNGSQGSRSAMNPMVEMSLVDEDEGADETDIDLEALRDAIREEMKGALKTAPWNNRMPTAPSVLFANGPGTLPPSPSSPSQQNPYASMGMVSNGYQHQAPPWGREGNPNHPVTAPNRGFGREQLVESRPAVEASREEHSKAGEGNKDKEHDEHKKHGKDKWKPNRTLQSSTLYSLNSFFFKGFSHRSPLRMKCFQIHKSSSWAAFFLCVTLANCLYIGFAPLDETTTAQTDIVGDSLIVSTSSTPPPTAGEIFDYACVCILSLEILSGCIAIGAMESEHTWFRVSNYNKLDLIVLTVTVSEFVANYFGQRGLTLRPFRLLRVFRAVTKIKAFGGVKAMIDTLSRGSGQLLTVFAMLMFFCAAFSICGMAIYATSFRRRCVSLARRVPACASDFDTGWAASCNMETDLKETAMSPFGNLVRSDGYPFEQWCKLYKHLNKTKENDALYPWDAVQRKYHNCQLDEHLAGKKVWQTCVEVENPSRTFSHFDHIGGAILSILQGAAPDGYYDVIWRSLMSEPDVSAMTWLLYIGISCICTFLLLGLFVAVVTGTFAQVRAAEGESGFLAHQSDEESDQSDTEWLDKGKYARHALNAPTEEELEKAKADADAALVRGSSLKNLLTSSVSKFSNALTGGNKAKEVNDDEEEDGGTVMRKFCAEIAESNWRVRLNSLVIMCHCGAMAMDQHDASPSVRLYSDTAYLACNFYFIADLILVFLSCDGFGKFWGASKNRLELCLVAMGCTGLASDAKFLILLPAFRLYYLMVYFPTLHALLIAAITSTAAILNLMLFIAIVAICFSIAGRYVFKSDMDPLTRSNFSTFPNALLTIFQLLMGDSWSSVVYSAMASKTTIYGQMFSACFIISWFAFSNLIVKNLFVAVIIENFQVSETIENIRKPGYVTTVRGFIREAYSGFYEQSLAFRSQQVEIDVNTGKLVAKKKLDYTFANHTHKGGEKRPPALGYGEKKSAQNELISQVTIAVDTIERDEEEEERDTVLGCFGPKNSMRQFFVWLGKQPLFDFAVYSAIIISCVFLMLAPPNDELNATEGVLNIDQIAIVNTFFTCLFTVEFFTKVMSQGLLFTKFAYLKSGWNIMDSTVLVFAWVDETKMLSNSNMAKIVRLARALRPLRLMKRNQSMRVVIDALIRTLAPVIYVVIFSVFTFAVAALIGMGLFGGKMFRCTTMGAEWPAGKRECSGNHVSDGTVSWGMGGAAPPGVLVPRAWVSPPYNFDSVWIACFTLYRVNTIKYVNIIYDAQDITDKDVSPKQANFEIAALFFIIYLIVGALFVMNLFVGFIVDGFNANKGATDAEIHYNRFIKLLSKSKPKYEYFATPQNPVSKALRSLVLHKYFQAFSATCVIINVLFMLADHADPEQYFLEALNSQNDLFFGILIGEIVLYFCAYGAGGFINDPWKMFDLFVCIGTLSGYAQANDKLAQFAKSFRLMRVVRLMKMFTPIRIILETMLSSLPQLANILLLILLVYSMFAVIAVSSFGTVKYGRRLGPTASFESFPKAMTTCYQMITGDEWMDITNDCVVEPPACTLVFSKDYVYGWKGPDHTYGDCGSSLAMIYFMTFKLVCESVMLNLFIGMILDNFSFITDEVAHVEDSEWTQGASSAQVQGLARCFKEFDCGSSFVPLTSLHALMCSMKQPLGYRNEDDMVIYGEKDRTAEILIRAELNILLRGEMQEEAKKNKSWWQRRMAWLKLKRKFICAVDFEDLLVTMLYWRLPSSVPRFLKVIRQDRVEEVVLMAQALAITDFFRMLVARRRQLEARSAMSQRILFRGWSVKDSHHTRRLREILAIKQNERQKAKQRRQQWLHLQVPPQAKAFIDFHPLDTLPTGMQEHNDFLVGKRRSPKPSHGLDLFLERSSVMYTVLRFIDSRNERKGLVLAAFEKEFFQGWHAVDLTHDTLFVPKRRKLRAEHTAEPWVMLDCRMRTREVDRRGNRLNRWKEVGVLLDVQSFVVADRFDNQNRPKQPRSIVRINIGTMRDVQIEEIEGQSKEGRKHLWHDGVLEVVGYVNTTLEEIEEERILREQHEKDAGHIPDQDELGYVREAS